MNYNFLFGEWNLSVVWSIGWLIEKQKESEDEYYRIGGHADPRAIGQRYGYRCASHLLETSWRFASHWVHSVIAFPWPAWSLHTFSRLPLHPVSSHSLFNSIFPFLFCHFYFIITDSEYMMLGFSRLGHLMFFSWNCKLYCITTLRGHHCTKGSLITVSQLPGSAFLRHSLAQQSAATFAFLLIQLIWIAYCRLGAIAYGFGRNYWIYFCCIHCSVCWGK